MKTTIYNVKFIIYGLFILLFLMNFQFEIFESKYKYVIFVIGSLSIIFSSVLYNKQRRCGHGTITLGRSGYFVWPLVVNPCPICGDDINYPCED